MILTPYYISNNKISHTICYFYIKGHIFKYSVDKIKDVHLKRTKISPPYSEKYPIFVSEN